MKFIKSILALSAAALAGFSGLGFAQTVANASFNANSTPDGSITDWTINSGSFGALTAAQWNAQQGKADLLSSSPGNPGGNVLGTWYVSQQNDVISQNISGLTVGKSYTVSFYEAADNRSTSTYTPGSMYWNVSLGSSSANSTAIATPGASAASGWTQVSLNFVASSATEALTFAAKSTSAVAPEPLLLLDGVSLAQAVPEPSTSAMMLAGVAIVGSLVRRRQARQG
ncbi:MAG: PEP-CTERM sorting domain-containing protein [Burkholderiaceae bacterium]|nr:PEP-CTERM sorting domain-containing protein [Roseateles sp.]MBV8468606.1 PEP-CTERM sorting domain-containing protein [Burkholderiaceae bacterium]